MITVIDLYRAIRETLEGAFENITIQNKDFKLPERPCFYIKYISGIDSQVGDEVFQNACAFDIIYFGEEEQVMELLEVQEKLQELFKKPLKLRLSNDSEEATQYQEINDVSSNLNEDDYILNCTISITLVQTAENGKDEIEDIFNGFSNDEMIETLEYII